MTRRNVAEGAEKPWEKDDKLPKIRTGTRVGAIWKYPSEKNKE